MTGQKNLTTVLPIRRGNFRGWGPNPTWMADAFPPSSAPRYVTGRFFDMPWDAKTHSLPAVGQLWRATALCVLRKSQPNSLIIKLKRSDAFRKQHGIQNVLHSRRRLLRCPGPNGPQDFPLLFPHWSNFASTSQPWALEFAHPFAQGFPTRRWCTGGCLSWHGPGINLQQTPVGLQCGYGAKINKKSNKSRKHGNT